MNRRFRLRESRRFQAIHREGTWWGHPLLSMGALPNGLGVTRCGFVVSRRLGRAVQRNRIRRRLREAVRLELDTIIPGWDLVFIARSGVATAPFSELRTAVRQLLERAHVRRPDP
jgi:ribonuclease P protein component